MDKDGIIVERTRGTPQGGVISPILSNLFLHYTFDLWMRRAHPDLPWCRYADDGLVHCRSEQEAEALTLQLHFPFEVSAACVGLVSSPPERPCENTVDRDAPLSELDSDATDFLDRPADQERCLVRRRRVFLSAGSALAR